MFNEKNKTTANGNSASGGTTLIGTGTTVSGDVNSNGDLRIDGTVIGNITSASKVIIGNSGNVEGDINCNQADITGKVSGNIKAKEMLQLRGDCVVTGNLYAGKLQVEPSATFNGQCHMGANIVEMQNNEQQAATR
jgi:cytoskeletal protein CcmA (bactofilin family)